MCISFIENMMVKANILKYTNIPFILLWINLPRRKCLGSRPRIIHEDCNTIYPISICQNGFLECIKSSLD